MIDEIWKPIKNYECLYEVSNLGRVRSLDKYVNYRYGNREVKGKILKPSLNGWGYPSISLSKNGITKSTRIHKLVAEHFLVKVKNKNCINHIDGNKENNYIDNLEWCNHKENTKHAMDNGLINFNQLAKSNGEKCSKIIKQYDKEMKFINEYISTQEASKVLNIAEPNISACACGKRKSAGGYIWVY